MVSSQLYTTNIVLHVHGKLYFQKKDKSPQIFQKPQLWVLLTNPEPAIEKHILGHAQERHIK
jgi:hypothetical protein